MPPDRRRDIADGLLILLDVIMLLVVFCAAWNHYDRLGWVRFVSALPFRNVCSKIRQRTPLLTKQLFLRQRKG